MANLYYLTGSDSDGTNYDQLIRATTPAHALELFHDYYDHPDFATTVSNNPSHKATEDDLRIFYIPNVPEIGVIEWHTTLGANVVAYAEYTGGK